MPQISRRFWTLLLAGLATLTLVPSQIGNGAEVKPGVKLSSQPSNSTELTKLRDSELIPLVEKGKITSAEARAFMRTQKKRLGMANPNKTKALDQILKQKGLN